MPSSFCPDQLTQYSPNSTVSPWWISKFSFAGNSSWMKVLFWEMMSLFAFDTSDPAMMSAKPMCATVDPATFQFPLAQRIQNSKFPMAA